MITKRDLLKNFHDNPLYKSAVSSVPAGESERIKRYADEMFGDLFEVLSEINQKIENNPDMKERLAMALNGDHSLIKTEHNVSGSTG